MEVVLRHATSDSELRVVLPRRAKFKHVKRAVAKHFGDEELATRLRLMARRDGIYSSFKDERAVGDRRVLLAYCKELAVLQGDDAVVTLDDDELSADDARAAPLHPSSSFSRRQAIDFQMARRDAFAGDGFQAAQSELEELMEEGGLSEAEYRRRRRELRWGAQGPLFERLGLEAGPSGFLRACELMRPHAEDPEYQELTADIQVLTNDTSSVDTWTSALRKHPLAQRSVRPEPRPPPRRRAIAESTRRAADRLFERSALAASAPDGVRRDREAPFGLTVVGSWNDFSPQDMQWMEGGFLAELTIGREGVESFQLLEDGNWRKVLYPSAVYAGMGDGHRVLGPDSDDQGRSWQIRKTAEEKAVPGASFALYVALDLEGGVRSVMWCAS